MIAAFKCVEFQDVRKVEKPIWIMLEETLDIGLRWHFGHILARSGLVDLPQIPLRKMMVTKYSLIPHISESGSEQDTEEQWREKMYPPGSEIPTWEGQFSGLDPEDCEKLPFRKRPLRIERKKMMCVKPHV